jgi:hypothetical protein
VTWVDDWRQVGGKSGTVESIRPLLDCMGKNVKYLGPAGSGQHTKMVRMDDDDEEEEEEEKDDDDDDDDGDEEEEEEKDGCYVWWWCPSPPLMLACMPNPGHGNGRSL